MEKFWTYPTEAELCGKKKARPVWKSPRGSRGRMRPSSEYGVTCRRCLFLRPPPQPAQPPQVRRRRVGNPGLLWPAPVAVWIEIPGACGSMITHPGFPIQARFRRQGSTVRNPNSKRLGIGCILAVSPSRMSDTLCMIR